MQRPAVLPALRGLSLLGGCGAASAGAWWLSVPALAPLRDRQDPLLLDDLLTAGCALALLACALWLLAGTTLTLLAAAGRVTAPGSRLAVVLGRASERACPLAVRTVVSAAVGVSLTVAVAGPSSADPHGRGPAAGLTGLALPDRTTGAGSFAGPTTGPTSGPTTGPTNRQSVVLVRPGDSLWSIASGLLGGSPAEADVTRAWHRVYAANRDRVGDDPDLIRPGTRLLVPGDLASTLEERP